MTSARILIVEDDRVVARDIQQQLARIGHVVVGTTTRGEDSLELALNTHPEIVLMDIRLEGPIDGIEAAQQIRERCHIPVVFLTAYADDETVRRASITEPFGYILKPFEDLQLRTVIEMALYKHAAERRLLESESRYVATLSSIGDAVIATDNQSRITFMNPVAEALTGWPSGEASGRPLWPRCFASSMRRRAKRSRTLRQKSCASAQLLALQTIQCCLPEAGGNSPSTIAARLSSMIMEASAAPSLCFATLPSAATGKKHFARRRKILHEWRG